MKLLRSLPLMVVVVNLVMVLGPSSAQGQFALNYVPINPCRVADTRGAQGTLGAPSLIAGASRDFPLQQGSCNIPSTAFAYSLNVTVIPQGSLGYLTVWPSGLFQPDTSLLNSPDGRVKANAAILAAGANGAVSVFTSDPTDLTIDVTGYFVDESTTSSLQFYPVTPCRVVDTRNPTAPLSGPFMPAGTSRDFPVLTAPCGLPSGAGAYSVNVTAIPHGGLGYLTIWASDQPQPAVSLLNAFTGLVTSNAAIVPAAADGDVNVFTTNDTDLIIDVNGYFAAPGQGGLSLYPLPPCRVADTRLGSGAFSGEMTFNIATGTCLAPVGAQAYVLNATAIPSGTLGFMTFWQDGQPQPLTSNFNSEDGATTSNMVIVSSSNDMVDAYSTDPTQLVLDISAFFAP